MASYCECGGLCVARGMCRPCYDKARRQDPELLEKFREANRRYYRTPKGRVAMTRGYQARVERERHGV